MFMSKMKQITWPALSLGGINYGPLHSEIEKNKDKCIKVHMSLFPKIKVIFHGYIS